jgi:hypothetical protein
MQNDFAGSENQLRFFIEFLYGRRKGIARDISLFIGTGPDFAKCNIQINFPHSEVSDSMEGGIY